MKKWIALLLAAVLCLSLAACGKSTTEENSGTTQGQTADNSTQDTVEPSDTDVPQDTGVPSDAEPTEQTVEITLDNWQDYFEIKQYLSGYIGTNDFGEPDHVEYYLSTMFTLKEEYAEKVDFDGSNVAIEYSGDYIVKSVTANVTDCTFVITGNYDGKNPSKESPFSGKTKKLGENEITQKVLKDGEVVESRIELPFCAPLDGWVVDSITYVSLDNKNYVEGQEEYQGRVNVLENIEFTRIQGTLVFTK